MLNCVCKAYPTATENDSRTVIKNFEPCQLIDPVLIRWMRGILDVKENGEILAMDITYYGIEKFLSQFIADFQNTHCGNNYQVHTEVLP